MQGVFWSLLKSEPDAGGPLQSYLIYIQTFICSCRFPWYQYIVALMRAKFLFLQEKQFLECKCEQLNASARSKILVFLSHVMSWSCPNTAVFFHVLLFALQWTVLTRSSSWYKLQPARFAKWFDCLMSGMHTLIPILFHVFITIFFFFKIFLWFLGNFTEYSCKIW